MVKVASWGGKRPGSGRKPSGIETATVSFRVSTEVKCMVTSLRERGIDVTSEVADLIVRLDARRD